MYRSAGSARLRRGRAQQSPSRRRLVQPPELSLLSAWPPGKPQGSGGPPRAQPCARWAPWNKHQRAELPQGADSALGWVSSSSYEPGMFAQTRKQGRCGRERVPKGANLRGALWPKTGQCEQQKYNTYDGLKHTKYFKSHKFIIYFFKQTSQVIFGKG